MAAPTLMTATPPDSFASRSSSFSRSQSESVVSISARSCAARASMASLVPPPSTIDGAVLVHHDAAGGAEHVEADLTQHQPDVRVDDLTTRHHREVVEERLATVTEERRLDGDGLQRLADRVDHQRRKRLALDVFGDDQQRLAALGDLLQQRQQVRQRADLLAVQQHQRVLEHRFLGVEVGDEVRRDEALVEADALGDLQLGVQRRRLLDGDDAVVAHLGHRLADQLADLLVARGHGGDLRDALLVGLTGVAAASSASDTASAALLMPDAQGDRVGTGGDLPQPGLDDRLRQHGRGGGAVAGDVVGLGGHRLHQLRAEVLERVFQVDLAGDGDAVIGYHRTAVRLGQHHVAAARPQRDPHGVGELVDSGFHCPARSFVELNLLAHRIAS